MPTTPVGGSRRATAIAALVIALVAAQTAVAPSSSPSVARAHTVSIYAPRGVGTDCARVYPLGRHVTGPRLLRGALEALLAGPTRSERAHGYGGWFSVKTAGHVRSVRIAGGIAYVDFLSFARDIPNASSSCGSALLLAQLDRTAKQFPSVRSTLYSFNGSPRAFYQWLQRSPPEA